MVHYFTDKTEITKAVCSKTKLTAVVATLSILDILGNCKNEKINKEICVCKLVIICMFISNNKIQVSLQVGLNRKKCQAFTSWSLFCKGQNEKIISMKFTKKPVGVHQNYQKSPYSQLCQNQMS